MMLRNLTRPGMPMGWIAVALAVLGLGATPVAAKNDGCPTWFPDLTPDCDREARPAGTVMPMSMPYIFEDPYITTGLNFVGIWHEFPGRLNEAPNDPRGKILDGGQLGILALQARLALTDRLAFIATKDGIGFLDPGSKSPVNDDTGFFNITAGFKYALFKWEGELVGDDHSIIVTPSLRYEIPVGNTAVLQGHDPGLLIPALSAGYGINNFHGIFGIGAHLPMNTNKNSENIFYNLHVNYAHPLGDGFLTHIVPFMEFNAMHWTASGRGSRTVKLKGGSSADIGIVPGFEAVDAMNLGNLDVSHDTYTTMAFGLRLPFRNGVSLGASYEWPLSENKQVTEQRVTFMLTWEI